MREPKVVLAYDVGATWIRAGLFIEREERLEMIARSKVRTRGDSVVDFEESLREALDQLPQDLVRETVSIGIGSIGPLDLKRAILNPPNIRAKNIDLKVIFKKISGGIPVYLANDCVAAVIGEYFYGVGRGYNNIVYITISTGIGAGVIVDGEPLIGKDGNAHEIGHLVIDRSMGIKCGCGGIGHWEGMCSGSGMPRLAEYLARKREYRDSRLREKIERESVDARDIFNLYHARDPLAIDVVEECLEINAAGVASVVNAYDPEILVLGGSVVLNNKWIVEEIEKRIDKYLINRAPKIEITRFEEDIVLIGAASIALKDYPKKNLFRIL
ncbi:MAG: ROK family protein [Sulfolobales archaeon]